MAICLPCFVIPFFLFIWRFIQPWILMFWNSDKKLPEAQMTSKVNENDSSTPSCPAKTATTAPEENQHKKEQ